MPRVPQHRQQVSARALPNVRQSTNVSAASFGAQQAGFQQQQGQALEATAQAVGNNAQRALAFGTKLKIRADTAVARDRLNKFRVDLDNKEIELRNLHGEDAFSVTEGMDKFIREKRKEYGKTAPLDFRLRDTLAANFDNVSRQYSARIMRHQANEVRKFEADTIDASSAQAIVDIKKAIANPELKSSEKLSVIGVSMSEIEKNTRKKFEGSPKRVTDLAVAQARQNAHMTVIDVLRRGDVESAAAYMEANKDEIDPVRQALLKEEFAEELIPQQAQTLAATLAGKSVQEQWAEIDKIRLENPKLAAHTESVLVTRQKRAQFIQNKAISTAENSYIAKQLSRPDLSPDELRAALPDNIPSSEKMRMFDNAMVRARRWASAKAAGKSDTDKNPFVFNGIYELAKTNPEDAEVALQSHVKNLSTAEIKSLGKVITDQKLARSDSKQRKFMASQGRAETLIASALAERGIDVKKDTSFATQSRVADLTEIVQAAHRKLWDEKAGALTEKDYIEIVAQALPPDYEPPLPESLEDVEADSKKWDGRFWQVAFEDRIEFWDREGTKAVQTQRREFKPIQGFEDYKQFHAPFGFQPFKAFKTEILGGESVIYREGINPDRYSSSSLTRLHSMIFNPVSHREVARYIPGDRPAIQKWRDDLLAQGKVVTYDKDRAGFMVSDPGIVTGSPTNAGRGILQTDKALGIQFQRETLADGTRLIYQWDLKTGKPLPTKMRPPSEDKTPTVSVRPEELIISP